MSYTVLVTGSLGLIGKVLVKKLKAKGFNVLEIDQNFPQNHFSHGDIRDEKIMQHLIAQASGVVAFSSCITCCLG